MVSGASKLFNGGMKRTFLALGLVLAAKAGAMSNGKVPESGVICGSGGSEYQAALDLGYNIYLAHDIMSRVSQDGNMQVQLDFFDSDGDYVRSTRPRMKESWDGWQGQNVYQACINVR